MNLTNCKRCRKPFKITKFGANDVKNYCPSCISKMLEEIEQLESIVSKNKNITLTELANKSSLSENIIKKYIDIGKLPFLDDYKAKRCKICGIHVKFGEYCSKCVKINK